MCVAETSLRCCPGGRSGHPGDAGDQVAATALPTRSLAPRDPRIPVLCPMGADHRAPRQGVRPIVVWLTNLLGGLATMCTVRARSAMRTASSASSLAHTSEGRCGWSGRPSLVCGGTQASRPAATTSASSDQAGPIEREARRRPVGFWTRRANRDGQRGQVEQVHEVRVGAEHRVHAERVGGDLGLCRDAGDARARRGRRSPSQVGVGGASQARAARSGRGRAARPGRRPRPR